jgi:hypothetical protein
MVLLPQVSAGELAGLDSRVCPANLSFLEEIGMGGCRVSMYSSAARCVGLLHQHFQGVVCAASVYGIPHVGTPVSGMYLTCQPGALCGT